MLKHRIIFGALMIAAMVLVFHLDNRLDRVPLAGTIWQRIFLGRDFLPAGLLMLGLFLVLIVLSAREFSAIARAKGIPVDPPMAALSGMGGCVLIYIIPTNLNSQVTTAFVGTLMIVLFLAALVRYSWKEKRTQGAIMAGSITMMAFVYLGMMPGFYVAIRRWHSAWVIAAILLITKCCDIGAYFTGRAIGRHKLIPWLSPGKTWEGLGGGVALSMIAAGILAAVGNHLGVYVWTKDILGRRTPQTIYFPIWAALAAGALIGLVGQFGDLTASLFKRDAGIKDSGSAIPGFGGLIDVFDSPVVVAPLAYWLLWLAAKMSDSGLMNQ